MLYRIFLKYPDALRPTFPALKERLEDGDQCETPSFFTVHIRSLPTLLGAASHLDVVVAHLSTYPAVVASTVNVICELARKNPRNYLPLAPTFFKLLNSLSNNWTLIKIVKLVCVYVSMCGCSELCVISLGVS